MFLKYGDILPEEGIGFVRNVRTQTLCSPSRRPCVYYISRKIFVDARLLTSTTRQQSHFTSAGGFFYFLLLKHVFLLMFFLSDSPGNCTPDVRTPSDKSQIDFGTRTDCCCCCCIFWCIILSKTQINR